MTDPLERARRDWMASPTRSPMDYPMDDTFYREGRWLWVNPYKLIWRPIVFASFRKDPEKAHNLALRILCLPQPITWLLFHPHRVWFCFRKEARWRMNN
jgi:hypothetical protein